MKKKLKINSNTGKEYVVWRKTISPSDLHLLLFTRHGKTLEMIRKKRNGKHIHPVCKLPWTNLLMCFPYAPYPHTSGPHFMATNIKSFRENWIRALFFIYLFFLFLLRLLHTHLLTLSMFFTPWIIYEKYVAFPYFHSLTVTYPYWRYVP